VTIQVDKVLEEVVPHTTWYVVMKSFSADDRELTIGEVVDTADWKYTAKLEQRRYIKPLPYGVDIPAEVKGDDGIARRLITSAVKTESVEATRPTPARKKQ